MLINNFSIILGRDYQVLTNGYISLYGSHMSLPKNGKNIIVPREDRICRYIEIVPKPHVNYIEQSFGVYFIFCEDDDEYVVCCINPKDAIWNMHFDCFRLNEGNGEDILL